ncbi:uncharacterized protein [Dermacentor andersoni]|uniref:uncharacterized protein isoform X2 n=1 Tax=Dermacentor andersoni TaxID=34620 RepID=UPI0024175EF1|nr:papilin-like isoform X3 [Dermacentor andersoni]
MQAKVQTCAKARTTEEDMLSHAFMCAILMACNGILCLEEENNRSQESVEQRSYVPPDPAPEEPDSNGILCLEVENNRSQKSAEERSYVPPYPPYEYPDPEESDYDRRPDFCFLPHDPGHCRTWNPAHLWFYDRDLGACSPFIYSKCGGNRNRFRSCAECKEACKAIDFSGTIFDQFSFCTHKIHHAVYYVAHM